MGDEGKSGREEASNVDPAVLSLSRKCSNCGQTGHNSRTCLEARDFAASEAEHKSHTADSHLTNPPQNAAEQAAGRPGQDATGHASDCSASACRETKKKGVPWTEEEHKLFLKGLQKLGKGDWRGISRQFVQTRSPTQVASHAQKYFIRQSVVGKRKRRSSLFDLVPEGMQDNKISMQNQATMKSKPAGDTSAQSDAHQPKPPFPPCPQGAEAFAWACWYQSMMLWAQAVYGQMPPNGFGGGDTGANAADSQDMAASMALQQQQATALMAQQQFSAAVAMGTLPFTPPPTEGEAHKRPASKTEAAAPADARIPSLQPNEPLKLTPARQAETESHAAECFGHGRLVKPKAHRARSVQSFGSLPSYMLGSQSDGVPQMTSCSKDSQDSFARLAGLNTPADPSSYTGGVGSTLAFNPSTHFEKSSASGDSRFKHIVAE